MWIVIGFFAVLIVILVLPAVISGVDDDELP